MRIEALTVLLAACGSGTQVYESVSYDRRFGDATVMDIHVPDAGRAAGRPTIMLIHGGGWRYGARDGYTDAAERYAAAGYVAATIEYRLVPSGIYPAMVQDCLCALSFLRANADAYGIDPDRIAVSGYSAGGQLSALVGTASDLPAHQPDCEWGPTAPPAAAIPGDGAYDFTANEPSWLVKDFLGGTPAEVPDNYVNSSPLLHVRPGVPPFLVIHGGADMVPIEGAKALVTAVRDAGSEAHFLDVSGAGHVTSSTTATDGVYLQAASDTPEAWAATIDFLDRTLGAP
jgi:acetyl esterase/lipase